MAKGPTNIDCTRSSPPHVLLPLLSGDSLAVPPVQYPAHPSLQLQPRAATTGNVDLLMPLQPKLLAILGN